MAWQRSDRLPASLLSWLLLPVVALVASQALWRIKGPFWLGTNLDPEYPYLFNALSVAEFQRPSMREHPGTFTQFAMALTFRVTHRVFGLGTFAEDVLKRPELYLEACRHLFVVAFALVVWWLGVQMRKTAGSWVGAFAAQSTLLFSPTAWFELQCVKPEPLILVLATAMVAVLVTALRDRTPRLDRACLSGALCGAALASKVTAGPLWLVPLLALCGARQRLVFLATALGTTFAILYPAFGNYSDLARVLGFLQSTARPGPHWDLATRGLAVLRLLGTEPLLIAALGASLLAAFIGRGPNDRDGRTRSLLVGLAVAQTAQIALLAARPLEARYLIPSLALIGPQLALSFCLVRIVKPQVRRRLLSVALALLFAGGGSLAVVEHVREWRRMSKEMREQLDSARLTQAAVARMPVVRYYRSSSPTFALFFGNEWDAYRRTVMLERLHPEAVFYHPWWRVLCGFGGPSSPVAIALPRFALVGTPMTSRWPPPPPLEPGQSLSVTRPGPVEAAYLVVIGDRDAPFFGWIATGLSPPKRVTASDATIAVHRVAFPQTRLRVQATTACVDVTAQIHPDDWDAGRVDFLVEGRSVLSHVFSLPRRLETVAGSVLLEPRSHELTLAFEPPWPATKRGPVLTRLRITPSDRCQGD